ncbi:MAG: SRPBCC domain-containing protein [Nocardioides sp.]
MKNLHTEIQVEAAPAEVWAVLTDFDSYPDWNPFLEDVRGDAEPGERLRVTLSPPGGRRITLRPTVTELVPGRVLEWWGHLGVRGIFDGRHRFELTASGTGTRLVQRETFTGLLVPLLATSLDGPTATGFALMNEALRVRVETQHAGVRD